MNIDQKTETSRELMVASLRVLWAHPRLVVFPLTGFGFTAAMVVSLLQLTPGLWLGWIMPNLAKLSAWDHGWAMVLSVGLFYLVCFTLATFLNVAFCHEALRGLNGERVSLRRGFGHAAARLGRIALWSVAAGTVGLLARAVGDRLGWFGRVALGLFGAGWSVAGVLVIPILVRGEAQHPVAVLRDSARLARRTWGEWVTGLVGFRMLGVAWLLFLTVLLAVAKVTLHGLETPGVVAAWVPGLWLSAVAVSIFLILVAEDIYRCALYIYATEGVVPEAYSEGMMMAGWKVKGPKN